MRGFLNMGNGRGALGAAVCLIAFTAAAGSADAEVRLLDEPAIKVAAWRGEAVWSRYDRQSGLYRLVWSHAGAPAQALPVAPSERPFDVDLGTNRVEGKMYAVYTRCGEGGCDIYRLRLATGAETQVTNLSSPRWDERDPTMLDGRIAFIRRELTSGGMLDVLRIGDITSSRALVRAQSLRDPELLGEHVAYIETRPGNVGNVRLVHLRNLRARRDRVIYRAASGGANFANVTGPSASNTMRSLLWARTNTASGTGNRFVQYNLNTGRLTYARGSKQTNSVGYAASVQDIVYSESLEGEGTCTIDIVDPPAFCRVLASGPLAFSPAP